MVDDIDGRQYARGTEDIVAQLRREFLDDAEEMLCALDVSLDSARQGRKPLSELTAEVRRVALILKNQSGNSGIRLLATVAVRLEDYLSNVRSEISERAIDELQKFVDILIEIIAGHVAPDIDPAELVRTLPPKYVTFDIGEVAFRNIEVLLVMLHSAQSHFVERELQQCGYRVAVVTSTFEALPLVVRTKPDLVIASAMMPELSGIDLAAALAAMPATRNIPTALITSLDADDEKLKMLPKHMPIIFKGPSFGDDLFKTLDRLFLI